MNAAVSQIPARARNRRHHDAPDTAQDFARLARMPDGPERDALKQRLAAAWLPMAHRLATRYRNRGENLDDLRQVAAMGLLKAVARYDPDSGNAFESYAVPTVVGEIKRHFRDHTWDVHVPRRVQELRNKVRATVRDLANTLGDTSPTVAQLAAHTGLTEEDVLTGLEAMDSFSSLSLDAQLTTGEDGYSLLDTLGGTEPSYDRILYRESVRPEIERLPEREQHILYLRFFCDMTQARIGRELGISQMHVSRLLSRACAAVRAGVAAEPQAAAA